MEGAHCQWSTDSGCSEQPILLLELAKVNRGGLSAPCANRRHYLVVIAVKANDIYSDCVLAQWQIRRLVIN